MVGPLTLLERSTPYALIGHANNLDDAVPKDVEEKIAQDEMDINEAISSIAKKKRATKKEEKAKEEIEAQLEAQDEDGVKTPEIKEEELLYKGKSQVELERTPSKLLGVRRLSSSFKSPLIVRSNSLTTLLANNNNLTTSSDDIKQLLSKNENLNWKQSAGIFEKGNSKSTTAT